MEKPYFCMGKTYNLIRIFFILGNSPNINFCKNIFVKLARILLVLIAQRLSVLNFKANLYLE